MNYLRNINFIENYTLKELNFKYILKKIKIILFKIIFLKLYSTIYFLNVDDHQITIKIKIKLLFIRYYD